MQSTFTLKQLTIAEFRQVRFRLRSVPEFDKLSRNPATSGRCRWLPGIPCQIPAGVAGSRPERWNPGWIQPSGRIWPERPDPQHLARSGCSGRKLARTAGFRSIGWDPAILCRIPAKIAGIRQKWPDSDNFDGISIFQILKNIFILFYINIFYFVNKI
jgi:hypothetical protein